MMIQYLGKHYDLKAGFRKMLSAGESGILLLLLFFPLSLPGREIIVSPAGPLSSIREAIERGRAGDRIVVRGGHYREGNLHIDKPLTLTGEGWPEIDGGNQDPILIVQADDVTIRGLVISNAGISYIEDNAGIRLDSVSRCLIENNRFRNNFFAVYLSRSENCVIRENIITGNGTRETSSGNGIHLWYCKSISILDNRIRGHRDGMYFEFVGDGLITGNVSEHNLRYGLHFMFSDSCRYSGNTFRGNQAGVAVMYSRQVEMFQNHFDHNWGAASYGLLLKEIIDSHIHHNIFHKNSIALYSEASNRNVIENNRFINNGWAIKLMANSIENRFTGNSFEENSFDVSTNSRQNFNTFDGNYWSGYDGYDLDRDGSGDVPYRPVNLFSYLVEQNPPGLILLKSFFVQILDVAEKIVPVLTPETLVDRHPRMRREI